MFDKKVSTKKEKTQTLELGRAEILNLLWGQGHSIPANAEIFITVPSGGDWSGMDVDIDGDTSAVKVQVRWVEKTEGN
jgi:hypothetical protein